MKKVYIIIPIILIIIVILVGLVLYRIGNRAIPFAEQYKFEYVNENDEIELPLFLYAEDENRELINEDALEFVQKDQKLKYGDFKITPIDGSDNIIVSFRLDIKAELECYFNDNAPKSINYQFRYLIPSMFDYYTGSIYKNKSKEIESVEQIKDVSELTEEDFKFITINWNDKEYKIGVNEQITAGVEKDPGTADKVDGKDHFVSPLAEYAQIAIMIPKDYDGIMIAIDKEGCSKETVLKAREDAIKKKEETETEGEEAKETEEIVHKLIDIEDESRNGYTAERFYILNVSRLLEDM